MRNLSTKVNRDLLTPGEFNSLNNELENIVTTTGGTLDGLEGPDNNLNMLGQASATYGSAGDFYEATLSGSVIVLDRDSVLESPQSYLAGLKIIFKSTFTNTGNVTVDLVNLGEKDFTYGDGSTLSSGTITLGNQITAVYNSTNNRFELTHNNSLVDNSIADTLHRHSELVASDGSPDPVLSIDAVGNITQENGLYFATDEIRSLDSGGLSLKDDSGTLGILINDGGDVSLANGTGINEFSTDETLAGGSDDAVPTEKAVKTFVNSKLRSYVKISEVQSSGVSGGTFTQDAWQTRVLNTEDSDTANICTLASNQITLDAGTYECRISAPAYQVNTHKCKLRNVTGSADILIGTSEYTLHTDGIATRSFVCGKFTVAASQALEVQHYCNTTIVTYGFGVTCAFGISEVYTIAEFWKVG